MILARLPRLARSFHAPPSHAPPSHAPPDLLLWGLTLLPVAIEAVLQAADLGLLGHPLWRGLAYQNGAFWAGLLHNWRPNYPGQPVTMFLSYAVLHGGIWHLTGNMLSLFVLGRRLTDRLSPQSFFLLYLVSAVGGGLGFGLLSQSPAPMVGASGALFGLAGALIWLEAAERRRFGVPLWPVFAVILGLVVLNALMWLALEGVLAWETHLGGFGAGLAFGAIRSWWHGNRGKKGAP